MGQASQAYTGDVESSLEIVTTPPLPNMKVGEPYQVWLEKAGGVDPVTFAVSAGALPAGLTLEPTGNLHGTPTTEGPYSFEVTVTDAVG